MQEHESARERCSSAQTEKAPISKPIVGPPPSAHVSFAPLRFKILCSPQLQACLHTVLLDTVSIFADEHVADHNDMDGTQDHSETFGGKKRRRAGSFSARIGATLGVRHAMGNQELDKKTIKRRHSETLLARALQLLTIQASPARLYWYCFYPKTIMEPPRCLAIRSTLLLLRVHKRLT